MGFDDTTDAECFIKLDMGNNRRGILSEINFFMMNYDSRDTYVGKLKI